MSDADRARWDARWQERAAERGQPSLILTELAELLPSRGRALDVGGGAGRHAIWLARRGLTVTVADISPVALGLAREAAASEGLSIHTLAIDLERDPLPPGPWDLVVAFHYLERAILPALPAALAPGGLFVLVQPTRRNLERHAHPSARFLLDEGEAPRLVPPPLTVERHDEGWLAEGRHEALVVARRPP